MNRWRNAIAVLCVLSIGNASIATAADGGAGRPLNCKDAFLTEDALAAIRAIREDLSVAGRSSREKAADALAGVFRETLRGRIDADEIDEIVRSTRAMVDNPIFDEAIARVFYSAKMRDAPSVARFQERLASAPEHVQKEFAEAILRQYHDLMKQAFSWMDAERFEKIAKRWSLDEAQSFRILTRYNLSALADPPHIDLILAIQVWAKMTAEEDIVRAVKEIRHRALFRFEGIPREMRPYDAEEVLIAKIQQPRTDADLAANRGTISDEKFDSMLWWWQFWGWWRLRLDTLRKPKDSAILTSLTASSSLAFIQMFAGNHPWTTKLMVALPPVLGGLFGMAPMIEAMTKHIVREKRDLKWIDILTVRQLSDLQEWIKKYPKITTEVGFEGMDEKIAERLQKLRSIRYQQ